MLTTIYSRDRAQLAQLIDELKKNHTEFESKKAELLHLQQKKKRTSKREKKAHTGTHAHTHTRTHASILGPATPPGQSLSFEIIVGAAGPARETQGC